MNQRRVLTAGEKQRRSLDEASSGQHDERPVDIDAKDAPR